jgi:type III pantothenate kinase
MNLVLDIGNTLVKAALFQEDTLLANTHFSLSEPDALHRFLFEKKPTRLIISSVIAELPLFLEELQQRIPTIPFTSTSPLPFLNTYKSAGTLGSDRLAAAAGAWKRFPGQNVLVIDSGTCIKYNFLNSAGEYLGGGISPGIDMRFRALNVFTGRLPEIEADYSTHTLVGMNTRDSILSGVMNGALEEVSGLINRYEAQYRGIITVLTGGNYQFFEKRLKNRIFALPQIILEGLNEILEYNVKN